MIYSFDIFDTLLLRPYTNPQEVWRVLEEQEGAKGFAKARKKADKKSYKRATEEGRETSIKEAYDLMPRLYRPLMQKEMELERCILRANPEMVALWNDLGQKGKKRVIVSDMYLSADFIKDVLIENGISGWDGFYLSSERNARKTTGKLFEIMLKEQKVKPTEVLHIGDNEWSDVKIPQKIGIQTQHYKKISDRLYTDFPFMRSIDSRLAGALAIGWHQYKLNRPNYSYWNKLGFSMGGVLGYMYVSWIVQTSIERGIDHLMFVGRDGYILEKICNALYPEIKTDYFYAPRLTSIAVLGATGNDPVAIADRQRYIDEHLQGVDSEEIKNNYTHYLQRFVIDDNTAMVDGCSSGFSAQRLVETAVGHEVFTFYLIALAQISKAAALYSTNTHSLPFQGLSEYIFGAPTPPIKEITAIGPVFEEYIDSKELQKMEASEKISEGVLACAKALHAKGVNISANSWLKYADSFMANLNREDKKMLKDAWNAKDVSHKKYESIIWDPNRKREVLCIGNFPILMVVYSFENGYYYRRLKLGKLTLARKKKKWWKCYVEKDTNDGIAR